MAPPADAIAVHGEALLTAIVAAYTDAGVGLPEHRFVSAGPPAWDCELVAVWPEGTFSQEGNVTTDALNPYTQGVGLGFGGAGWACLVLRCVPIGTVNPQTRKPVPPSAAELHASGVAMATDAQLLRNALAVGVKAGTLPRCNTVAVLGGLPLPPSGGYAGWVQRVRIGVE